MTKKQGKILVVDDNAGVRKALQLLLTPRFAEVELLPSPVTLPATMDRLHPDAVLLDMNFHADISSGNEGLFWTDEILRRWPSTSVSLPSTAISTSSAVPAQDLRPALLPPQAGDHPRGRIGKTSRNYCPRREKHTEKNLTG